MTEKGNTAFRRNLQERVSSPDQLTDYLRVTNPGIWVLLASVILLLAGVFAWASIGTLETVIPVKVNVEAQKALVVPEGAGILSEGMPLRVIAANQGMDRSRGSQARLVGKHASSKTPEQGILYRYAAAGPQQSAGLQR